MRLREACRDAGLLETEGWRSPDDVGVMELPLRNAVERTVGALQGVLEGTVRDIEMGRGGEKEGKAEVERERDRGLQGGDEEECKTIRKREFLAQTKAAEVGVVRHVGCLFSSEVRYRAEALDVKIEGPERSDDQSEGR